MSGAQDLRGRTVIVTGASSDIGAATARALHATDAHPVLAARRSQRLEIPQRRARRRTERAGPRHPRRPGRAPGRRGARPSRAKTRPGLYPRFGHHLSKTQKGDRNGNDREREPSVPAGRHGFPVDRRHAWPVRVELRLSARRRPRGGAVRGCGRRRVLRDHLEGQGWRSAGMERCVGGDGNPHRGDGLEV